MEFIVLVGGIIAGYFARLVMENRDTWGTLRIDQSDPEDGPYLFLELNKELEDMLFLREHKHIRFKVEHKDFITQK